MRRFHKTEKGKQEGAFRRCFYPGRNEFTFVGQNDRHYKLKKTNRKKPTGLFLKEEKPEAHVNWLNGPPPEIQIGSNWILHDLG